MDYEDYGLRALDTVTQAAVRLGEQWAGVFLSREQFEAQADAYERIARIQQPRVATLPPIAFFLLIGLGVLLVTQK